MASTPNAVPSSSPFAATPATSLAREDSPAPSLARENNFDARFWLLAIALVTILVDLFFFTGFYSSDDISYYQFARNWWVTGHYASTRLIGGVRLPIIVWNYAMIALFGLSPQAVAATYIAFHLLLLASIWLFAVRYFDKYTGLIAVYLAALAPPLVLYSTTILPDIPMAVTTLLSLYCFLRGYDRTKDRTEDSAWWMLACGLCVGMTYMIKESGLILLPFYFVLWLVHSRGRRFWRAIWVGAMFPAGVALMLLFEYGAFAILLDKPFFRLGWTVDELNPVIRERMLGYGLHPLTRLDWAVRRMNEFYGFMPLAAKWAVGGVLLIFPFLRGGRWSVMALALWQFLFLTWGTMRWTEYLPPSIKGRYYIPVLPLVLLMIAFVLARVFVPVGRVRSVWPRRVMIALLAVVFILLPLPGLQVVNEKAGKAYQAGASGNTVRAVRFAMEKGDGPIVLSSYLRQRTKYIFQDRGFDWLLKADWIGPRELTELLQKGPFYYVESRVQPFRPRTLLDGLVYQLVTESTVPIQPADTSIFHHELDDQRSEFLKMEDLPKLNARTFVSISPDRVGYFQLGDQIAEVREIGWFVPLKTRLDEYLVEIGHDMIDFAAAKAKRDRNVVRLFKIQLAIDAPELPAVAASAPASMPADSPVFDNVILDMPGNAANWQMTSRLRGGRNKPAVPTVHKFDDETGDIARIRFTGDPKAYEWLTPTSGWTVEKLQLPERGCYELVLDADMTKDFHADLRIDMFSDPERKRTLINKRLDMKPGAVRFSFCTQSAPVYLNLAFRLQGTGDFSLKQFRITRAVTTTGK